MRLYMESTASYDDDPMKTGGSDSDTSAQPVTVSEGATSPLARDADASCSSGSSAAEVVDNAPATRGKAAKEAARARADEKRGFCG